MNCLRRRILVGRYLGQITDAGQLRQHACVDLIGLAFAWAIVFVLIGWRNHAGLGVAPR